MLYYFLPHASIYGGVKVGYQFVEMLRELGAPGVAVTPEGSAPTWFRTSTPTIAERAARRRLTAASTVLFSWPPHHDLLRRLPGRKVFHCQGTDPLIDPVIADPDVTLLTCWPQAARYVSENAGRATIDVGISLSDCFYGDERPKAGGTVAYMPRRGGEIVEAVRAATPGLRFRPIDGVPETRVAEVMKSSEYYLATSVNEWFGLPALEAMAAGCVVVSVPVLGGMDYLRSEQNCIVANPHEVPARLRELSQATWAVREGLRREAVKTADAYRRSRQVDRLGRMLEDDLAFLMGGDPMRRAPCS
jgi:glycosyltransferase involved in cell wall biosynthesis